MNGMFFWDEKRNREQWKEAFSKNWRLYLCEALGLAIFMISACFFGAMLEGNTSWHKAIPNVTLRLAITGVLMGGTALFIFYSPFTKPSGSQINPAVTLCFLKLKRIGKWDAFFYIIFQIMGGTLAVCLMAFFIGPNLTSAPVNYAATVPVQGVPKAFITEFIIGFVMMSMVLFTSSHQHFKKYTRIISGCFVCLYVIVAGPVSGFGMNPARSLASAIPSNIWTAFWIYALVPVASMLLATEVFVRVQKWMLRRRNKRALQFYLLNLDSEKFKQRV
jgi:aquaporin Z